MKKITLSLVVAVIALASCQKPETALPVAEQFTAIVESFDSPTKTSMTPEKYVVWSQNDRLAIFQGSTLADEYKVSDASVGKANGTFSIVADDSNINGDFSAGTELPCNVALYPYADDLTLIGSVLEDEGTIYEIEGLTLPAEQVYVEGSFANGAFPMVAVTENLADHNLKFKNLLGALKLQLKGTQTVKSIKVTGRNNEILSGAAVVTAYTNNLTPSVTMTATDDASKSVTLDCGDGVQLSESTATDFIIALPPVLFNEGFTVTVTDSGDQTYEVTADVANTVLRSSILTMPAFTLGQTPGDDAEDDDATYIEYLLLDKTSLTMYPETSYTLVADIDPVEVTYPTLTWSSSDNTVATVDQTGKITTVSDGTATITALAVGGVSATCTVKVKSAPAVDVINYVVDGVDYGPGINIGGTVWAPVNCGYEPATADYNGYPYGKLYQWGRKYGQGYSTYYDATEPEIVEGPVMPSVGKSEEYADVFFTASESPYDWCKAPNDALWNSGTEEASVKTETDPCPTGWRVPTYGELDELSDNYSQWTTNADGQNGYYFVGEYTYIEDIPQVFFPAAGYRYYNGDAGPRGSLGYYWSSKPYDTYAYYLYFSGGNVTMISYDRAYGYSVRCVQDLGNGEGGENSDDNPVCVEQISLDKTSLIMYPATSYELVATIEPVEVTNPTLTWSSSDETVAKVDQTGKITTVSDGTATITALAVGGVSATCTIKVKSAPSVTIKNYVVDGIDYGKGINIGGTVWAPVNCGYEPATADYKGYPYGKLYQWGRKYGQGYSTYYDATEPEIVEGPVMPSVGKSEDNKNVFYRVTTGPYDWCSVQKDDLWGYGTDEKSANNPCPDGWRIPTYDELDELRDNYSQWTTNADGHIGYYFVGEYTYTEDIPQVFFPAAGCRSNYGGVLNRGDGGYYWSSRPVNTNAYGLHFNGSGEYMQNYLRAYGFSVRCVQE